MQKSYTKSNNFRFGEVNYSGLENLGSKYKNNTSFLQRNMQVEETGQIKRRPGLKKISDLEENAKIISMQTSIEDKYILAIGESKIRVFKDDKLICTISKSPFKKEILSSLQYISKDNKIFVTHPDIETKVIVKESDTNWKIQNIEFDIDSYTGESFEPFAYFEDMQNKGIKATPIIIDPEDLDWDQEGAGEWVLNPDWMERNEPAYTFVEDESTPPPQVEITCSDIYDIFNFDCKNIKMRIGDGEYRITHVVTTRKLLGEIIKLPTDFKEKNPSVSEQAFSKKRGWIRSINFYQNRMVVGGSKSLPKRIWMSKTDNFFNFNLGSAYDGDAIEFDILSQNEETIQTIFTGRHLQVFTNNAEWIVTGFPITPTSIQLQKQTELGSNQDNYLSPQFIEGSTIFISKNKSEVCEFFFGEIEEQYQTENLVSLSNHLLNKPLETSYNKNEKIYFIVNNDGSLATLTMSKNYGVRSWGLWETKGSFISVESLNEETYVVVRRNDKPYLEKFDFTELNTYTDCEITISREDDKRDNIFEIIDYPELLKIKDLKEQTNAIILAIGDGEFLGEPIIENDAIKLQKPVNNLRLGIAYRHILAPSPEMIEFKKIRLLEVSFRLSESKNLSIDTGQGIKNISLKEYDNSETFLSSENIKGTFSGDINIKSFGWKKAGSQILWKIDDYYPNNFKVISSLSKFIVNK
ncbi:MAG: hypothetical protein N4A44_00610 [Alphaproteobacteria bacterium]|jgi:hypothetical protein|nr:hypothetical protein [Alphaproteobacteria bacterium]